MASPGLIRLFALYGAATNANVYYAQSLVGPIAHDLHITPELAGSISTLTQLGYGAGLFFLLPLGDIIDNRKLVLGSTLCSILALLGLIFSTNVTAFFIAAFLLGMSTIGCQVLITLSTHITPPEQRGRVIGFVVGGLVSGIMLSRPIASLMTAHFGWHSIFVASAVAMSIALCILWRVLPTFCPPTQMRWGHAISSTAWLVPTVRPLRERMFYQGGIFCIFNMFWTGAPLLLQTHFGFSQDGVALFALAGAAGAASAPVAGRFADRGWISQATCGALLCVLAAAAISGLGGVIGSVLALTVAAIVLDAGAQTNQVMGQRTLFDLDASIRGRLNACYMTFIFLCGAFGSVLGSYTYVRGGWEATMTVSGCVGALLLAGFFRNRRRARLDPWQMRG